MRVSTFLAALLFTAAPAAAQGGFLGVALAPSDDPGATIQEVYPGTAAEVAGLEAGDVILVANGEKISGAGALVAAVGAMRPGDYLKLTLRREGEVREQGLILGRRSAELGGEEEPGEGFTMPRGLPPGLLGPGRRGRFPGHLLTPEEAEDLFGDLKDLERLNEEILERLREHGAIRLPRMQLRGVGPGAGRSRIEIRSEAEGVDAEEFFDGLTIDVDTGDGSGVSITFPGSTPQGERDGLRHRVRDRFGPKARVEFDGPGFRAEIIAETGQGADGFDSPLEIDIDALDEDGDLPLVLPEMKIHKRERTGGKQQEAGTRSKGAGSGTAARVHDDLETALAASKRSGKPVLVDFYADWCGPCKRMGTEVLSNAGHQDLLSRYEFVKINVDENRSLAEEYGVQGIPDLRVLDSEGAQIAKFVGYPGVEGTRARLQEGLEKAGGGHPATRTEDARTARRRARLEQRIGEVQAQIKQLEDELRKLKQQDG